MHRRNHPMLKTLRSEIAKCKHGVFDTPYLRQVKKKCKLKEWGKTRRLGSWKEVCNIHGENVAIAALKQGNLPYCPHTLLLPGHNLKWPDSHQFILSETYWRDSWEKEVGVEADGEDKDTQHEIDAFCDKHKAPEEVPAWDAFMKEASTRIPEGEVMPEPTPTPTPAAEMSESERRVSPEYTGRQYDLVYTNFKKDSKKFVEEWPKKQRNHDVNIKKTTTHSMCSGSPAMKSAVDLLAACVKDFGEIQTTVTGEAVTGKHSLSQTELQACIDKIDRCRSRELDLTSLMKPLIQLSMLPTPAKA